MQRLPEGLEPRIGGARDARAPCGLAGGEHHQRVGGRGVAVDGDGVEGVGDAVRQAASARPAPRSRASVKTKDSMVAMSGAIMPAPLAMPLMVTVALPILALRGRHLGEGVGGHDRLARRRGSRPARAFADQAVHHAVEVLRVERLADHAGRGEEDLVRSCSRPPCAAISAVNLHGVAPALAGEGIGVAGIDHQRAGLCRALRCARHHSTGADGHFERVNTPAAVVPVVEQRQQHVGAAGVADAGCGGRQPHAGDRRHVRHVLSGRGGRRRWTSTPRRHGRRMCPAIHDAWRQCLQ